MKNTENEMERSFKSRIADKELLLGSWITLAHPAIPEIMSRAGFEWLTVDLEHSVITIREAEELIRIISLCGSVPLVRLSANDPVQIKRVMDAGAHGVIVPMVNTAEQAIKAVEAVRYPPYGKRGVGLARAQGYGSSFDCYNRWLNQESTVIVQIEHIQAVENLEIILSTEGVDGFIVGPYDMSASLGIPGDFENQLMVNAMNKIQSFVDTSTKIAGIHIVEPDMEKFRFHVDKGYRFIGYSLDIRILDYYCRSAVKTIFDENKTR